MTRLIVASPAIVIVGGLFLANTLPESPLRFVVRLLILPLFFLACGAVCVVSGPEEPAP